MDLVKKKKPSWHDVNKCKKKKEKRLNLEINF